MPAFIARFQGPGLAVRQLTREGSARYRAGMLQKRIQLSDLQWKSMLTLTFDACSFHQRGLYTKQAKARYAYECWKHFRARMWKPVIIAGRMRQYKFKYLMTIEWTKLGNPHLHIMVDRFLPKQVVSRFWTESGGGPVMRFRYVANVGQNKHAVRYTLKYVTKALGSDAVGIRRWAYSKGLLDPLPVIPQLDGEKWRRVTLDDIAAWNGDYPVVIYGDEDGEEYVLDIGDMEARRTPRL
jgi:hypothetical protein